MLNQGIAVPFSNPWSYPVVIVQKKGFCVDYRKLSNATTKDATPLPRMDDSFDTLLGARRFSILDLQAGYWQVPGYPISRRQHSPPVAAR